MLLKVNAWVNVINPQRNRIIKSFKKEYMILYTGKYSPSFYFRPFHPPCLWANFKTSRRIEMAQLKRAELFASIE